MRGQTYPAILSALRQQTEPAIGKIQGSQLKLLQSFIGGTGLRNRLANATPEQSAAAAAVTEAIQPAYLAREDSYSINLADPQVAQLLTDAVSAGVLTAGERAYLVQLATYQKPLWPNVTLRDVVGYFEPSLVDVGDWIELDPGHSRQLRLKLTTATPEPTYIVVQMAENDGEWSEWFHATAVHGIQQLRPYTFAVPNNGLQRRMRWRGGEYRINGIVTAV
ncbi:MAG: hypothetical protein U5L02_16625 [Rheinheimera sp.]|nr:hypothetical protein [Rheinheimera sp.]